MVRIDDYLKRQRDLYEAAMKPYKDLTQHPSFYDDMLRSNRQLEEAYKHSSVAREAYRYEELQDQLVSQMRGAIADVNATSYIAAAMRTPTALALVEQQRRLMSDLAIPASYRATMEMLGGYQNRALRYTADIERLLDTLRRYADAAPAVPDEETLAAVRDRVAEIVSASIDKVSGAVTALLRWLAANARRIGWSNVSFILFTIVYPLILTVYQDELKQMFHETPIAKQKAVERDVVAAVTERVPAAALRNVRYVGQPTLNVRSASRRNSAKVGELHFGDVVVIVRSTKDWTLIEFEVDDAEVRGWVLTRGLRRFNLRPRSG